MQVNNSTKPQVGPQGQNLASTEKKGELGHLHLMTQTIREIYSIFNQIGFDIATGPELEIEKYNFDMLNVPADHPARDMQDTFWVKRSKEEIERDEPKQVLRTQTSAVQVRYMEKHQPPLKVIVPGKVFRNEATDATHEMQFYQCEGLVVGEKVSMADLKGTLEYFFEKFFGEQTKIRLRPSFFPFTEPSVEIDVWINGKWMEVMGGGMVHPKVLEGVNIDAAKFSGFAFGFGIDRLIMVKYGIPDVRMIYQPDLRIINQF